MYHTTPIIILISTARIRARGVLAAGAVAFSEAVFFRIRISSLHVFVRFFPRPGSVHPGLYSIGWVKNYNYADEVGDVGDGGRVDRMHSNSYS
jgi:hypothetical protein